MRSLMSKGEYKADDTLPRSDTHLVNRRICDAFQTTLTVYINNLYFPWVFIVLILNRKNIKRPVILILILYWFFQSTGNLLQSYLNFTDIKQWQNWGFEWPYTIFNWYVVNAVAHIFWESGEIIADWYPLLRTKALVQKKSKLRPIYIICIIYNIAKAAHAAVNFKYTPSIYKKDGNGTNKEMLTYRTVWWIMVIVLQSISLLYDIFVIIALKSSLFNKFKGLKYKTNNFLEKFKHISEFRIFISIIISLIFFPFVIVQIYYYFIWFLHPEKDMTVIKDYVEFIRLIVLRFTYTFMYIDQILLRFYVKQNKSNYHPNSIKNNSVDSQRLIPNTPPTSYNTSPTSLSPNLPNYMSNYKVISLSRNNNYYGQNFSKSTNNNINSKPYNKSDYYFENLKNINN